MTVLIGFAVAGRPICGVVHQPYYMKNGEAVGRTAWGMKNVGHGGIDLSPPPLLENLTVTVSRSHSDKVLENALVHLKPHEIVRVGGAGHKV